MMKNKNTAYSVPTTHDLKNAYDSILHGYPGLPSIEKLGCYFTWSRFDPRLAEICVQYIFSHWKQINPIELNSALLKTKCPNAFAVFVEFVNKMFSKRSSDRQLFQAWSKCAIHSFVKANDEQFYIGLRELGGSFMLEDVIHSWQEYRKWGYFSQEDLLPKFSAIQLSTQDRYRILKDLFNEKKRIQCSEYRHALKKKISKRQAERDLVQCGFLRKTGNTKGSRWILLKK